MSRQGPKSNYSQPTRRTTGLAGPIETHFNNWNKFENFLKFADRKQLKERLKDFDAPNVQEYVDPEIVEKIAKNRRPPKQPGASKKVVVDAREEHR